MKNSKELIDQLLHQQPIIAQQAQIQEPNVYAIWPQVLRDLGLDTLVDNSSVISLECKQLCIAVPHSVFLQELKLRQNQWLPALEATLKAAGHPHPYVLKVRFCIQNSP